MVLASPSSVLKVCNWSCVGTRGGDTPTSGQASKALLHVIVGAGELCDILQRVESSRKELSSLLLSHVEVFAAREW